VPINNFKDLYDFAERQDAPIMFRDLVEQITLHYWPVDEIKVIPISYPRPNGQAHFKWGAADRIDKDGDEFRPAQIRYCDGLNDHDALRRFMLTKELMHVFDPEEALVDSREKFVDFLHELQNKPLLQHATPAFKVDVDTRWMAALVLCPKKQRDAFKAEYDAGLIDDFDVANRLWVPEDIVPSVMDDYYDLVHASMVDD